MRLQAYTQLPTPPMVRLDTDHLRTWTVFLMEAKCLRPHISSAVAGINRDGRHTATISRCGRGRGHAA